jgi:biofilm PGA synthesis N-glycosyltransferase PgaC
MRAPGGPGVSSRHRILLLSPVRNEGEHIELVARALVAQTHPPDRWIVVDDDSTDDTLAKALRLAEEIDFMQVLATPAGYTEDWGDRHAVAAAPRAFNWALGQIDATPYTHLGKLDGDIELPPDYFERLLAEFDADPALGIGGGVLVELVGASWKLMRTDPDHVRGALKLYSQECFRAIGGVREQLGWDGIDEAYAAIRGYRTASFGPIVARHHRACGTADGVLRGRIRGGETHYVVGFSLPWVILKSCKSAFLTPRGISGAAFLYGYLRAAYRSLPRIEDPEYLRFRRQHERRRLRQALPLARR